MSAAEREAERRYVMGPGAGHSYPREAVVTMKRGSFEAGAAWQAERDAEVTDEMVDAGARAVSGLDWSQAEFGYGPSDEDIARAVLEAVIGKEQSDEL